jgi:hypothetical protein
MGDEQPLLNLYSVRLQRRPSYEKSMQKIVAKDEHEAFIKATEIVKRDCTLQIIEVKFVEELQTVYEPLQSHYLQSSLGKWWNANKGALSTYLLEVIFFVVISVPTVVYAVFFVVREVSGYVLILLETLFTALNGLFGRHNRDGANNGVVVRGAPGARLLAIVDFLFPPVSVELTFKPLIADLRIEYFEALAKGRTMKARWIRVRYFFSFLLAMGLNKVFSFITDLKSVLK